MHSDIVSDLRDRGRWLKR